MVLKRHEIRESSPVEEIIGKTPRSIVRWGSSIVAIVFLGALLGSWLIRYPYSIPGTVKITTEIPPAPIMAHVPGTIEDLYVHEGQAVKENELLGVIQSSVNIESVILLEKFLSNSSVIAEENSSINIVTGLPASDDLGELQILYSDFIGAFRDYLVLIEVDSYGKKISAIEAEINGIEKHIEQLKRKESFLREKVDLASSEFFRDSMLYVQEVTSTHEYENAREARVDDYIELQDVKSEISLKELDRLSKLGDLVDYKSAREIERRNAYTLVETEKTTLLGTLERWRKEHLLISPINGKVTLLSFWGENQIVNSGDIVMTIIPQGEQRIIGRSEINMRGAGRVSVGRKALIRLDAYPYLQYGMLEGVVESVSLAAQNNTYIVDIELPAGLVTSSGDELNFTQNMPGRVEIITDRLRLIERLIEPFRHIINRNKILAN